MDLACLPEEVLYHIAVCLAPSRSSIEAMRAVCRQWRAALPATCGPWVVLAPRNADLLPIFLGAAGGAFSRERPLFSPPQGAICWSCCRGLMALRYMHNVTASSFCVNCGQEYPMLFPHGMEWINLSDVPHLLCAVSPDQPVLWWATQFSEIWDGYDFPLGLLPRSVVWVDEVCYIAAFLLRLVVDASFHQRVPPPDELEEVYYDAGVQFVHPPLVILELPLDEDDELMPWTQRGPHVFHIGSDIYVCVLLRHMGDQHIEARLFSLELGNDSNYFLVPSANIGLYSVFLGSNQAFAVLLTPSMRANTVYIIDDDGMLAAPRVVAIDFFTSQQTLLHYPLDIGNLDSFLPAGWLVPLSNDEDIEWHCT